MESNGKVIAVTGARGKLGPFVAGALGTAGYRVATDNNRMMLDLAVRDDARYLVESWRERFGQIDGLIALTGHYVQTRGDDASAVFEGVRNNLMTVVNVVGELLQELKQREGSIVAIGAAGHYAPKETAYRAGKAALDAYLGGLSHDEPLVNVAFVAPDGPIDTDEKRAHISGFIVSLLKREPQA